MSASSLIPDSTTDERLDAIESFIQLYLGPRKPEYGSSDQDLEQIEMPRVLHRFFRFAGRWPGQRVDSSYANRFCAQDILCSVVAKGFAPGLEYVDGRLVFVFENQGVWIASTERSGDDPPVWISVDCSRREKVRVWKKLERPLSHFLVSFVLQELLFGSVYSAVAPNALDVARNAGLTVEPIWIQGEYGHGEYRPSYYWVAGKFLFRQEPKDLEVNDWFGCNDLDSFRTLSSIGLPATI